MTTAGTGQEEKKEALKEEMAKAGPGLIEPDMELFCKAAADGNALGDCPFTHYVHVSQPPTNAAGVGG